ncbi:DUF3179 domain-containing protein [Lutibacter sp.]|uniref:DUF3179 domain-containing protein n=1 Tax=Lutibacter sp. TaxID=1925666 RepID=UPI0025C73430|nr:DUF3179 domain-containing protein [Lutibacter sp.]MCF6180639.1 DUF3179 domain-containing protein [Lutibacter sp.]
MNFKIWITVVLSFTIAISTAQFKNPKDLNFTWKTDTLKHSVNLSEIQIVLPKGSFPTLDNPKFVGKTKGLTMFFLKEPVIAVEINGEAKAYSLNILTMHEIANDMLGGQPILVTYCPLCNSGIVYSRKLNVGGKEEILEFEPSGMLRNSDMVMLDRKTESLWQQLLGEGIVGKYTNAQLNIIPSLIISVDEFFSRYPKGKILSKETGFVASEKQYGKNPYVKYDGKNAPIQYFFDSDKVDKRLPALERIVDIEHNGDYKIYSFTSVAKKGVLNDTFKGTNVVLFYQSGTISVLDEKDISKSKDIGSVTIFKSKLNNKLLTFKKDKKFIIDTQTNSKWDITGYCFRGKLKGSQLKIEPHSNHFAFAWLAFHPKSEIYKD